MPGVTTAYQAGVHGSRPAASAGCILYACSTHSLIYRSDGTNWTTWMTIGSTSTTVASDAIWDAAGDLAVGTGADTAARLAIGATGKFLGSDGSTAGWQSLTGDRKIQAGPYTTTSGSVVDVDGTNLVITITTGARRVLLTCNATYKVSATGNNVYLDVKIDGASYLAAATVYGMTSVVNQKIPIAFMYLTDVLSAGSHTFKLGWAVDGGNTATLENVTFCAMEQAIVA